MHETCADEYNAYESSLRTFKNPSQGNLVIIFENVNNFILWLM